MTELPSVDDVNKASQALGLGANAAELHGGLCGWLSAGGAPVREWPARVLADDNLPLPTEDDPLSQLLQASVAQLEDRDFAFELLLSGALDGPGLMGVIGSPGLIIITGMIDVPRVVSSTGAVPAVHESPEIDDLFDPGDLVAGPADAAAAERAAAPVGVRPPRRL